MSPTVALPSTASLVATWTAAAHAPAPRRLGALLSAAGGGDAVRGDTLGARNRRLLQLHRALVGAPLEAQVTCAHCGAQSEFAIPAEAILATPAPEPGARVAVPDGDRTLEFRLPRMDDLEAASGAATPEEVRRAVLERCRVDGDGGPNADAVAEELGRRFEALDPAASVAVEIACSGCGRGIAASVDLATFVARDLDRFVDGLLRDVDTIASAYGWEEERILALPPERRRRYVGLILARGPARGAAARRAP